ncbi:1-3-beta-glucan synthase [Neoconidiobolus thromboides FSU 785]|nr:1-3-beta-glucan synthase [Neoconidiobolus thromboides FSU 785]
MKGINKKNNKQEKDDNETYEQLEYLEEDFTNDPRLNPYNTSISFINNYLDENQEEYDIENPMRSPYYSSDSSVNSPNNLQVPKQPSPILDVNRIKGSNQGGNYPESILELGMGGSSSSQSSIREASQEHFNSLDLFGSLRSTKLADSRYAKYAPSTESLLALIESKKPQYPAQSVSSFSRASSWVSDNNNETEYFDLPGHRSLAKDYPWPAWSTQNQVPLSKEEILDIFMDLKAKFGFQTDSIRNQYDSLMTMLDSRASRMSPTLALLTLHADYIGGVNSNYRKWFFAAEFNKDSSLHQDLKLGSGIGDQMEEQYMAESLEEWWRNKMSKLTQHERVRNIALYLLIWGEALNIRYLPEVICFIFKLANDHYLSIDDTAKNNSVEEGDFLNNVITPLYNYIRDQNYEVVNGQFLKRERDHAQVIGYDDINETFWTRESCERLVLEDKKTKLMSLVPGERYQRLKDVNWKKSIKKTYFERRTWLHIITNFSRLWIFHISVFYYFWIINSPFILIPYDQYVSDREDGIDLEANEANFPPQLWSLVGLGGAISAFIALWGSFCELFFIEKDWAKYRILFRRMAILSVIYILNVAPAAVVAWLSIKIKKGELILDRENVIAQILGPLHAAFAVATTIFLTVIPPANLFNYIPSLTLLTSSKPNITNRAFTADYASLDFNNRAASVSMWALIGACKLIESYLALIWSVKNAFRALVYLDMGDCQDALKGYLGGFSICKLMGPITMIMMVLLLLVMFFLDSYLWYIIISSLFSIANAFSMGISILSPWKNIFGRLPKRIYTKLLATSNMEIKLRPKMLCSQVWNAIIISMYRDHLVSIDHVQKLLYQQVASDIEGKKKLKPPSFFVAQEDTGVNTEFYPPGSEAERRISFFASSLSTVIPEPLPVENMPTFTVFTPHYAEKILLSLREIIREDDQYTRVTLLEYLKSLYTVEWDNFVKDTKILAEENSLMDNEPPTFPIDEIASDKQDTKVKMDDLPFYCIGFKSAAPEFTLRTRIWASLRSQTLYRTISGFMNYSKALKLLHRIENPELVQLLGGNSEALDEELDLMARRKFNFLISMQRYTKFNKEEKENVDFLLKTYPDLQIAYLEEEKGVTEDEVVMYSCLTDGHMPVNEDGKREAKYRIRIPGNPILGDGKSDNQNHAIIFTRGEYIQVIDANQDNYLEEALKIRSVLAEFEEYQAPQHSPYAPASAAEEVKKPVAIIGAREYIFSENIGVLGDIAAGKEQTFGTLTHRILSTVGGRLHYGHPDFLNMVFMNTRGGLSKAQKGLHLNEDIYAGMNAFQRGGRIKHCEYIQCGKGRDLGFCSVLNFNTKIGTGMGEQLLSREYYYLYTQLPLDRFLTLFYAHPGFQVNNMMIMFSIQIFLMVLACVGVITSTQTVCSTSEVNNEFPVFQESLQCWNKLPVTNWIDRTVVSVFIVFFITFLPLILQVLSEQGFVRMAARLGKQLASFSPMFEIFTTQIFSNSILSNMSFGGARYIGTGRGFATTRQTFAILYSRFASSSIYSGLRGFLFLMFACLAPHLFSPFFLYFWFTVIGLVLSPWIFNPHQLSLMEFILDYRNFLRWMSAGNSSSAKESWVAHCRYARTRITGQKRKKLGDKERKIGGHVPRAHRLIIFFSEVIVPMMFAILTVLIYGIVSNYDPVIEEDKNGKKPYTPPSLKGSSGLVRAILVAFLPIILNAGILIVLFPVSLFLGPVMTICAKSFGAVIAAIAHAWAVLNLIICFVLLWFLENFNLSRAILGITAAMFIQRFIFALLMFMFLTPWWTGKWISAGLGWMTITQPLREFVCKIIEMSLFATDFISAHLIFFSLAPFTLIPYVDKWHSTMLFWLRPSRQIRPPIFSLRQMNQRRRRAILYGILFVIIFAFFVGLIRFFSNNV